MAVLMFGFIKKMFQGENPFLVYLSSVSDEPVDLAAATQLIADLKKMQLLNDDAVVNAPSLETGKYKDLKQRWAQLTVQFAQHGLADAGDTDTAAIRKALTALTEQLEIMRPHYYGAETFEPASFSNYIDERQVRDFIDGARSMEALIIAVPKLEKALMHNNLNWLRDSVYFVSPLDEIIIPLVQKINVLGRSDVLTKKLLLSVIDNEHETHLVPPNRTGGAQLFSSDRRRYGVPHTSFKYTFSDEQVRDIAHLFPMDSIRVATRQAEYENNFTHGNEYRQHAVLRAALAEMQQKAGVEDHDDGSDIEKRQPRPHPLASCLPPNPAMTRLLMDMENETHVDRVAVQDDTGESKIARKSR